MQTKINNFLTDLKKFPQELKKRNLLLFYLGNALSLVFVLFLIGVAVCQHSIYEICHWLKPGKFAFSFALYAYTMGWFFQYLNKKLSLTTIKILSWMIAIIIALEMVTMFVQSFMSSSTYLSLGVPFFESALIFNKLTLFSDALILVNTGITIFVALQFFRDIQLSPVEYLWSIRASFVIFNLSCLIGLVMLLYYAETVNSDPLNLPFTSLSTVRNNLLSMHFFGLHVMQVLPLLSYYFHEYFGKRFLVSLTTAYSLGTAVLLLQLYSKF